MILADTSVWVRGLMGREGVRSTLDALLRDHAIGGHELVDGELLAGDTGGRERMLRDYRLLPWAHRLDHDRIATWARQRRLCGCGVGWIDLHLLAAAEAAGWLLWTADERLAALARELHRAWRPA
ncbi:MAG: PIN domain-containing protein [Terriglobales bacterium]